MVKPRLAHPWDQTPREAIALQGELAARLDLRDRVGPVRRIAGVDCGFEERGTVTRAALAVLSWPELEPLETVVARLPTRFPYVPGLLSWREIPAVLKAFERLTETPDLLLCDGQGIAHPRRLGVASHLGLLLDLPAIGVGKSRLVGEHAEPANRRGASAPLTHREETVGAVVRTRQGVKPVFVSPGHRVGMASAVRWVLDCAPRFRLPEPIRAADRAASRR